MNNKLKIAFLHYTYPPIVGGVENLIRTHALLFSQNGYKTTIFTSEGKESNTDISIIKIPELSSLSKLNVDLRDETLQKESYPKELIEMSETIFQKLEEYKDSFDILIAHNIFSLALNPAIAIAVKQFHEKYPDKKIIAWTHDLIFQDRETNPSKQFYPNQDLDSLIHSAIDDIHYIAISEFLKKNLIKVTNFPENRITVIPNGIDLSDFLGLHSLTQKILAETSLLSSDCLLFFPAKIMPHKNVEICLEALAELKKHYKNSLLIFSAKGFPHSEKTSMHIQNFNILVKELELSDNILMLSDYFVEQDSNTIFRVIRELYMISDIVLYPSKYENFGLPLIESGLTKTPIICSNLEVFDEVSGGNVYQTDDVSAQSITNLILKIMSESKQTKLFQRVKQNYLIQTIFEQKIIPYIESI